MIGVCRLAKEADKCDRRALSHTSAVTAWTPIFSNKFGVLIPMNSADANVEAIYYEAGRFIFPIYTAITVAKGDVLYYLVASSAVTNVKPTAVSATTSFPIGVAVEAGTATAGYVEVELFKNSVNCLIYKTVSAADEAARIWISSSATSGILRGLSVRAFFTGAGTATGDGLRAYIQTDVSVANMHGAHITAQLGDESAASVGGVTGQAAGVRATIGIGTTNTGVTGTIAALRLDSYFLSSAATAASSFIYAVDVGGSYGVDAFLRLGAMKNSSTNKAAPSAYTYVSGGFTVTGAAIALKIVTGDGTFYLPAYASLNG
jgi:hypothetical protein